MKKFYKNLKQRWSSETPRFFKWIVRIGAVISGAALAIQASLAAGGATEPEWWTKIYPYLIALPAGMATVAKLTHDSNVDKDNSKTDENN